MKSIHTHMVAMYLGEGGHPATLLIHQRIGIEHITLHFRIEDGPQGVLSKIGIPDPVVYIERPLT